MSVLQNNNNNGDMSDQSNNAAVHTIPANQLAHIHATICQLHNTPVEFYTLGTSNKPGFVLNPHSQTKKLASNAIIVGFPSHVSKTQQVITQDASGNQVPSDKQKINIVLRDATGYCNLTYTFEGGEPPIFEIEKYYNFLIVPSSQSFDALEPKRYFVTSFRPIEDFNEITHHNLLAMKSAWAYDPDTIRACQLAIVTIAKIVDPSVQQLTYNIFA
ncbi:hypothetical protein DFA_10016 [Cavenderia fasciculata]|uniref:Uncharacterized protein n=1 Tax=Cavenderia fasciculata TaxID=261658 RepID=F4Q921_CACFS|nr:uncharacterized protein DFA_10016 [Cavenderia fasciculata]EGG15190.1 hypothetical protein DFA_10016 [Cavenderia fasciculata]|eukprot:XP_004351910.1 hypothetical protein DFA_10016 [Cavenderia fasciculata]